MLTLSPSGGAGMPVGFVPVRPAAKASSEADSDDGLIAALPPPPRKKGETAEEKRARKACPASASRHRSLFDHLPAACTCPLLVLRFLKSCRRQVLLSFWRDHVLSPLTHCPGSCEGAEEGRSRSQEGDQEAVHAVEAGGVEGGARGRHPRRSARRAAAVSGVFGEPSQALRLVALSAAAVATSCCRRGEGFSQAAGTNSCLQQTERNITPAACQPPAAARRRGRPS